MSTTLKGTLHGTDTKDTCEIFRQPRKYKYTVKATGGGKLRMKIKHYRVINTGLTEAGTGKGSWNTLVDRSKIASGTTLNGSFTAPETDLTGGKSQLKVIFSRGALTKGVDYDFFMEPA